MTPEELAAIKARKKQGSDAIWMLTKDRDALLADYHTFEAATVAAKNGQLRLQQRVDELEALLSDPEALTRRCFELRDGGGA